MSEALQINHDLADVVVKPNGRVNQVRLKKIIRSALDQYLVEDRIPVEVIHDAAKERHGQYYQTTGYYVRLYRQRANLTQVRLAHCRTFFKLRRRQHRSRSEIQEIPLILISFLAHLQVKLASHELMLRIRDS